MATVLVYSIGDTADLTPVLAEAGHRVVEVYDSGEIIQLVLRSQFDVVIVPERAEPTEAGELLPLVRRLTSAAIVVAGDGDDSVAAKHDSLVKSLCRSN